MTEYTTVYLTTEQIQTIIDGATVDPDNTNRTLYALQKSSPMGNGANSRVENWRDLRDGDQEKLEWNQFDLRAKRVPQTQDELLDYMHDEHGVSSASDDAHYHPNFDDGGVYIPQWSRDKLPEGWTLVEDERGHGVEAYPVREDDALVDTLKNAVDDLGDVSYERDVEAFDPDEHLGFGDDDARILLDIANDSDASDERNVAALNALKEMGYEIEHDVTHQFADSE